MTTDTTWCLDGHVGGSRRLKTNASGWQSLAACHWECMILTADVFSSLGKLIVRAHQFHFGAFNDRNLIPDETKKMLGGMAGGCFASSYQHAMKALIKVDNISVGDLSQDSDDLPSGKLTFLKAKPSQPIVMFGGQHRHATQAVLRKCLEDALDNLQKKRMKLELIGGPMHCKY
ncbi:hypothetical protein BD779DRAFT_1479061 [Infundibulicybe gibba]|nr:hypothetical protein BD779DRAFT_1479061 [Infundibulicybe gibba]